MDTKFVIFLLISTFLIAAIYSTTAIHYVSAKMTRTCTSGETATAWTYTCCTVTTDDKTGAVTSTKCSTETCSKDPDGLCTLSHSTKKVPNSDILKDNGILQGTNDSNSNDNVKEPKAPKVPEN